jgi:hypothetical protein
MIPGLAQLLRTFGVNAAFAPLVLAAGLTGLVFLVPTLFRWFGDPES